MSSGRVWFSGTLLSIILAFCGTRQAARASTLYATSNEAAGTGNQLIFTIDQQTGAATPLGLSGLGGTIDLASDTRPESARIFVTDATTNALYQVNPLTGSTSLIGSFGDPQIASIAFDITTGKLYGTSRFSTQLYEVDPATAATTLIGPVGFEDVLGLGFDLNGHLFGSSTAGPTQLIQIDTATGAGTSVGAITDGVVDLAARPEDGVMFAVSSTFDSIYTMDTTTGQTTLVGPYDQNIEFMNGLAFSPIPEPASVLLLVPLAMVGLARRRAAR